MTSNIKKAELIERISSIRDEEILNKLVVLLDAYAKGNKVLLEIVKPLREKLDIEALKKEQNYQSPAQAEINKLIAEINLQEPLEELLNDI